MVVCGAKRVRNREALRPAGCSCAQSEPSTATTTRRTMIIRMCGLCMLLTKGKTLHRPVITAYAYLGHTCVLFC
jgi:hypothetical protein